MNLWLIAAAALSVLIGFAHSVLGEWLILGPLLRRGELPRLLESTDFTRQVLRFAWHLTTLLLVGIGAVIAGIGLWATPDPAWILRVFSVTFGLSALLSLIGARGKHFSWWVFLIIAAALWYGSTI